MSVDMPGSTCFDFARKSLVSDPFRTKGLAFHSQIGRRVRPRMCSWALWLPEQEEEVGERWLFLQISSRSHTLE